MVIVTRNRPDMLALSLPLILAQTRLPERVIVVDGSDDPGPVAELLERIAAGSPTPVEHVPSPPGMTRQRNIGLARSAAEVVIFPDDDSLLYAEAAAEIMAAYERDAEGIVAAVCAAPALTPPTEVEGEAVPTPPGSERLGIRLRHRIVETGRLLNPFLTIGTRLNARHRAPPWLGESDCVTVPYMTGFRMSFRRNAIAGGFDETFDRYCWFEDIDASFSAMRHGLVIAAHRALIHHHRVPGPRGAGRTIGLWAILNCGYVAMKHVRANPRVFGEPWREVLRLRVYCLGRLVAYTLAALKPFGRARLLGAMVGFARLGDLLAAPPEQLSERYRLLTRDTQIREPA